MAEAYIVAAARTAGGKRGGRVSGWHPVDLGAEVAKSLISRTKADPAMVEDVIWGCVSQVAEQSTNVARNVALAAGFPETVPGTSIDRQCGSSQQAVHFAAQAVMSGMMDIVIAGGVESMTRTPMGSSAKIAGLGVYMSPAMKARYPHVIEFSQFDGAEMMAKSFDFTREQLDEFSLASHMKAAAATKAGAFNDEIVPLEIATEKGKEMHVADEGIRYEATAASMATVKLLREGGRITAATASQICDGASGVMVVNERGLKTLGVKPLARIHHMSVLGGDPVVMLDTPLEATKRALKKAGMSINDIDLYEVNEAFAPVPMAWLKTIGADPARLNVNGGAIALGHPLGASGTKLMTTLIYALQKRNKRYGLQTMCEGGGMANVTIIERL